MLAALAMGALALPAAAQLTQDDVEPTGTPNAAYQDSIKSAQTEVIYLRPTAEFRPDESITIEVPETVEEQRMSETSARWFWGLIFGAILAFVLFILVTQGGAIGVSFGQTGDGRLDRGAPDEAEPDPFAALNEQPLDQFLASLRAMADRRLALILLVGRTLERAADLNELRLARAQTARDVVRMLPRDWHHFEALRNLVRQVEIVHFGGRDLAEDSWEDCYNAAQPILRGAAR